MELTWQQKCEQNWDTQQIRNLMGKYEYYHTAHMHTKTAELFALKTNGVLVDNSSLGVFKGEEGIRNFFVRFHQTLDGDKKGVLCIHTLTTEVIEVARDGKTAKGLWFSPGLETRSSMKTGKLEAYWVWGKYAVDFIKEDGEWKFWHFHITDNIHCDYDRSWVDAGKEKEDVLSNPNIPKPDGPSKYHGTAYTAELVEKLVPPVPEPYDSYTGE